MARKSVIITFLIKFAKNKRKFDRQIGFCDSEHLQTEARAAAAAAAAEMNKAVRTGEMNRSV